MIITPLMKIQNLLKQAGGYQCPHFEVQKTIPGQAKKSCCGRSNDLTDQYVPVCGLINGVCTGLAQCPRIDVKTKSELIQKWMEDLKHNKTLNPQDYIKR